MSDHDSDAMNQTQPENSLNWAADIEIPLWLQVYDVLQDHFRLAPDDARLATDSYFEQHTSDIALTPPTARTAAADAYTAWAATAHSDVRARLQPAARPDVTEANINTGGQLDPHLTAADHSLSPVHSDPDPTQGRERQPGRREATGPQPDPNGFLFNTAYLDGAAAAIAELVVGTHPEYVQSTGLSAGHRATPAEDLAAAEAAITLLRENRDLTGYTEEDAATAKALLGVLDAAQVWDQVPSSTLTEHGWHPLEEDLQPDRIRQRLGWDDTVILDAGFAGATVTVQRTSRANGHADYELLAPSQHGQGPLRDVDPVALGMIAAGDRVPKAEHAELYSELGAQIREHLVGLSDAVAAHRQQLITRETRRIESMRTTSVAPGRPGPERAL